MLETSQFMRQSLYVVLELTEVLMALPPESGISSVSHHAQLML